MATRILIVDDDQDFVAATRLLLEAKGYTVSSAHGGSEGIAQARASAPDLILLDVMMSYDSEGLDTARSLKEDPSTKSIPIILLTGIRKAMKLHAALAPDPAWLPVAAVLEKPLKPRPLLDAIEAALVRPAT